MTTVFRYALTRLRGQILGWGIAMFLLGLFSASFYGTVVEQQEQILQLLKAYPPELLAFFGDASQFATPEGYLSIEYFSFMPIILGIFAVLVGSGLLASDEENGTLDLVLAHPVSRTTLFAGRVLAFAVAALAILAIAWLGLVAVATWGALDVGWSDLALPFLSLYATLMFFGALALALSMLLPSRRLAAMTAGFVLVASYFITSLARISKDLATVEKLSPLYYYQSGDAINGLNLGWFVGLLAAAAVFAGLAWWRFGRRDIRVSGEGSWSWPLRRRKVTAEHLRP